MYILQTERDIYEVHCISTVYWLIFFGPKSPDVHIFLSELLHSRTSPISRTIGYREEVHHQGQFGK